MIHFLKTWQPFYSDVVEGRKCFEIRKNHDRVFSVDDILILAEFNPSTKQFTEKYCLRKVCYILDDRTFLPPDTVAMSIHPLIDVRERRAVDAWMQEREPFTDYEKVYQQEAAR